MSVVDDLKANWATLEQKLADIQTSEAHAVAVLDALKASVDALTAELASANPDLQTIASGMASVSAQIDTERAAFEAKIAADTPVAMPGTTQP